LLFWNRKGPFRRLGGKGMNDKNLLIPAVPQGEESLENEGTNPTRHTRVKTADTFTLKNCRRRRELLGRGKSLS